MSGIHTLRRTAAYSDLTSAAGLYPACARSEADLRQPVFTPSISIAYACQTFKTTPDELLPRPLFSAESRLKTSTTSSLVLASGEQVLPFPDYDDAYATNLLEPAVQITFGHVDWHPAPHSSGNRDVYRSVSPARRTTSHAGRETQENELSAVQVSETGFVQVPPHLLQRNAVVSINAGATADFQT